MLPSLSRESILRHAGLVLALLLTAGCPGAASKPAPAPAAPVPPPAPKAGADAWFPMNFGGRAIRVQVVVTPEEQARGLMHRAELAPDDGMIFVNERGAPRGFWMLNTPLPLDIGYFDEQGVLQEVHRMFPNNTTSVASRRQDIRYALEMNQGWFERHGVRSGAPLDLPALRAALAARGFDPARYAPAPAPAK